MWQDMTDTNAIMTQAREAVIHPRGRDMLFLYPKVSRAHTTLGRKCPIGAPPDALREEQRLTLLEFHRRVPATMVLPGVRPALSAATGQRLHSPWEQAPDKSQSAERCCSNREPFSHPSGMLVPAEEFRHRGSVRPTKHCQGSPVSCRVPWGSKAGPWQACGWRSGPNNTASFQGLCRHPHFCGGQAEVSHTV